MSLEKRFRGIRIDLGDLFLLRMKDGSEIMARYGGRRKDVSKKDEVVFDGIVVKDGDNYEWEGRRAYNLPVRSIAELTRVDTSITYGSTK